MRDKMVMIKLIATIVITFVFAFLLFTDNLPFFSSGKNSENTNGANSVVQTPAASKTSSTQVPISKKKVPVQVNGNTPKPVETAKGTNKQSELQKKILGSWQLVNFTSQGRTANIDTTKKVPSEKTLIYSFDKDKAYVCWAGQKIMLTYTWINDYTIQTVQPAASADESEYKESATIQFQGDKLYMNTVDEQGNSSNGVFVRYKGSLPETTSK